MPQDDVSKVEKIVISALQERVAKLEELKYLYRKMMQLNWKKLR